ncbi:recombinase family protein [Streptomyces spiramyceticus]|uniref:recombinase family protein n=1 Tax=Streptomyces spiramyceticus TaxID=299717 RepID=UPI00237BB649|nr:recombinase family protein [Streptomyces spiramyceticus]
MRNSVTSAISALDRTAQPQLRAVDYLRVSTEEQKKGYGITYTGKRTVKHIQKKGWLHVDTFADEGFSGSLDHTQRPDLKRLMELAQQTSRPFDVVVVAEERAIGRRDRAFWPWVWKLEDLGIFTAVVRGDYDNTTEEGRSKMRKEQDKAEVERITIRDRTQGGVQEKAEVGGHPGGVAPYGYRIENQGKRGESRLVLDTGEKHEGYPTLHRAHKLLVEEGMNTSEAEDLFNAEGVPGPTMDHWPRGSLRHVLTGQAVQESVRLYRDPKGPKIRLDVDGKPLFGQTVVIQLDPVFNPTELKLLNLALARTSRGPRTTDANVHPLSKHVVGLCGAYYTGVSRIGRDDKRAYRCSGKNQKDKKKQKCDCAQINADALENRVWTEVCRLLEDPERLNQMATDWLDMVKNSGVDYEARIIELDTQIDELDATIAVTMAAAARQAARKKLGAKEAQESVERTVRPLNEELAGLEKLRAEADSWLQEAKSTVDRARDLQALAKMARVRLHTMDARQQEDVIDLLDLRVTILGDIPKKLRADDKISAWFRDRDTVVPALTDEAWGLVEPIFNAPRQGRRPMDPRGLLGAMLDKARTGSSWAEVGIKAASAWPRWVKTGQWDRLMEALDAVPGAPAYDGVELPPLRVEGRVDPRLLIGEDEPPDGGDPFKASDYKISPFELESALLEHEAVAEAAVVPAPDALRLSVPKAYVVLAEGWEPGPDTAKVLFEHSRSVLAAYQRIRRIEFAELPKTVSGKIRRIELRERTAKGSSAEYAEYAEGDLR